MDNLQPNQRQFLTFGDFSFDEESNELFRNGESILLQPKPAELLGYFLKRPGRLISSEEIKRLLWAERTVEYEQRIRAVVRDIRVALGDDPNDPAYLETVSRRGYRLIADVSSRPGATARQLGWRRVAMMLGLLVVLVLVPLAYWRNMEDTPTRRTLAVMPVQDLSNTTMAAARGKAWTHSLIAEIAKLDPANLVVIGRTSSGKFRGRDYDLAEVRRLLGANLILELTVLQNDRSLNATASLVETAGAGVVWSNTYSVDDASSRDMLSQIVAELAKALEIQPPSHRQVADGALDLAAQQALMDAQYLLARGTPDALRQSIGKFERVLAENPDFLAALVGKSTALYLSGKDAGEILPWVERALALDEDQPQANFLYGWLKFSADWDWDTGETYLHRAVEAAPGMPQYNAFYSAFLRAGGRFREAEVYATRALQADPLSELVYRDISWLYLATGQYGKAIDICTRALAVQLKSADRDHFCLVLAYELSGIEDRAVEHANILMSKDETPAAISTLDQFWAWQVARYMGQPEGTRDFFNLAASQAMAGNADAAIDALQHAYSTHSFGMVFLLGDVRFDSIRDNEDFKRLIALINFPRPQAAMSRRQGGPMRHPQD